MLKQLLLEQLVQLYIKDLLMIIKLNKDSFTLSGLIKAVIKSKWRNMIGSTSYKVISILNLNNTPFYQKVDQLYEAGQMKSPFIETVSLKDGSSALIRLEKREITGKLVLIP